MRKNLIGYLALGALAAAALACALPGAQSPTEVPTPTEEAADAGEPEAPPEEEATEEEAPAAEEQSGEQGGQAAQSQAQVPTVRATQNVAVRSGPSVWCPIIGNLDENEETRVTGITANTNWWRIPYNAGEGWISTVFTAPVNDVSGVQTVSGLECAPPTATPVPPTNTPVPTNTPLPPTPTTAPTVTATQSGATPTTPGFAIPPSPTPTIGGIVIP